MGDNTTLPPLNLVALQNFLLLGFKFVIGQGA